MVLSPPSLSLIPLAYRTRSSTQNDAVNYLGPSDTEEEVREELTLRALGPGFL